MGDEELAAARRRGEIRRLRHGCYTAKPAGDARTEHLRRCWAFVLSGGDGGFLTGASAAVAFELDLVTVPSVVHLASPHPRRARGVSVVRRELADDEVVDVAGLPVVAPWLCIHDVAARLAFPEAVVIADSALRRGLVTPDRLRELRDDQRRRRAVRRVVDFADGRSESVGESLARVAIDAAGVESPELQVELRGASGRHYRVDFFWPRHRTIGEFDGKVKYRGDEQALWNEKRREDDLRAVGYRFARFGTADARRPEELARIIRSAFARAA